MLKGIRLLAALALSALAAAPLAALPVNDDPKEPFEYFAYPTGVLGMPQGDPGILVTPEGWISTGKVELRFTLVSKTPP
jgi:hypothetical protein